MLFVELPVRVMDDMDEIEEGGVGESMKALGGRGVGDVRGVTGVEFASCEGACASSLNNTWCRVDDDASSACVRGVESMMRRGSSIKV